MAVATPQDVVNDEICAIYERSFGELLLHDIPSMRTSVASIDCDAARIELATKALRQDDDSDSDNRRSSTAPATVRVFTSVASPSRVTELPV